MEHDHDIDLAVMRLAWRLDALDKWRTDVDVQLAGCRKDLDGMLNADAVAEKVAAKVAEDRRKLLGWPVKLLGLLLTVLLVAQAVVGLVNAVHG